MHHLYGSHYQVWIAKQLLQSLYQSRVLVDDLIYVIDEIYIELKSVRRYFNSWRVQKVMQTLEEFCILLCSSIFSRHQTHSCQASVRWPIEEADLLIYHASR